MIFIAKWAKSIPQHFCRLAHTDSMGGEFLFVEFKLELFRIEASPIDQAAKYYSG